MILAFGLGDIVKIPFGWLLDFLYQFAGNYGLALILFSLLIKLILLPASAKSKKSTMAMTRLAPLAKAIQDKYPDDQNKANMEVQKLYKEEGVSMFGGCLWMLLPMLLLFPLFYVIREPITYMLHFSAEESAAIVETMKNLIPDAFGKNRIYDQLVAAAHLSEYAPQLVEAIPELAGKTLESLNFNFLGIDLSQIPNWRFWTWTLSLSVIGGFLIPVISAGSNILTMLITQKMNAKVVTDENGEMDEAAAKTAAGSNKSMMLMMPLITLFIGFSYPCALSLYWLSQNIFGMIQDVILTKHYKKVYADEDDIKRRVAAEKAAAQAERERIRAQRRAENPDGITTNTSKKKLQNKQQAQREQELAAARKANSPVGEDAPLSGDPERPFCKGRAYDPDRYGRRTDTEE